MQQWCHHNHYTGVQGSALHRAETELHNNDDAVPCGDVTQSRMYKLAPNESHEAYDLLGNVLKNLEATSNCNTSCNPSTRARQRWR